MKLSSYPEYKDSEIIWMGKIPAHWSIKKNAYLFTAKKGSNAAQLTKEYCTTIPGEYPVYSGQTENHGVMSSIDQFEFDAGNEGYLFSTTVGAKAMTLMHLKGKFSLSQNCLVIIPKAEKISIRYFYYSLRSLFAFERDLIPEHMQASFRMEDLYQYRISLPTRLEQIKIAQYLDCKTLKLDTLISKQEQLIELLQEKRQVIISHAITKGINPDVKMKDSGDPWIGMVPESWSVVALRRILSERLTNGIFKKKDEFGSGTRLVNVFDIYRDDYKINLTTLDRVECTPDEIKAYQVLSGDLFFVRSSLKQDGIAVAAVAESYDEDVVYECHLIRARSDLNKLYPRFGSYLFNCSIFRAIFISIAKITTMTTIDQEAILSRQILLPSISEQISIVQYIDEQINKIDTLIDKAKRSIELAKEHRTALISAAVTGKIDVREAA